MSIEKILYVLSCQHKTLAPSYLVSGTLHCPLCHADKLIRGVEVMEWRANCYSCKFARWAGMSEATASMFADSHARKNPFHSIGINREQHLAARKTLDKMVAWRANAISS